MCEPMMRWATAWLEPSRHGTRARRSRSLTALAAALSLTPVPVAPAPASGGPIDAWDGSRAELFLTGIAEPTLAAGGVTGEITASVINRGPADPATNVKVRYVLPTGLTYG